MVILLQKGDKLRVVNEDMTKEILIFYDHPDFPRILRVEYTPDVDDVQEGEPLALLEQRT
jgi:hypothetical protein